MPYFVFSQNRQTSEEGHAEIAVGAGAWSGNYLFDGYSPLNKGKREHINQMYSGTYHINIRAFLAKRLSIGITAIYENKSGSWQANYNPDHFGYRHTIIGTFRQQNFTLSPEINIYYMIQKHYRLYCSFGMGLTFRSEYNEYSKEYLDSGPPWYTVPEDYPAGDNSKMQGNVYLSPIGISAGNKLRWFTEIGLGYKGLVNAGLSLSL